MPEQLLQLARRMRSLAPPLPPMANFKPNEANALDYRRAQGHYISAHCDDRQLSGDVLANLSLAGAPVLP